jgi:cation diffusion facilitator family transporter
MAGGSHGSKAIIAAFLANLGIAIAKFAGFLITRSSSMLAESIHSVADTANQGLLWMGGVRSRREADEMFQFGYGRERYFWSFIVSLVLFTLGAVFAIYEGIAKLLHPHEIESAWVAIGILLLGIVLEGWSFRTAVKESKPLKGDRSWWQFIRTSRVPELPVVLMEDLGALTGLVLALGAITLSVTTGNPRWDGVGTVLIGSLLAVIAVILAIEMKGLLIGEGAGPEEFATIRSAIDETPHVDHVIHLRTQYLGPDALLVATKLAFDQSLDIAGLADVVNDVERRIREKVPHATPIYVEPDLMRDSVDGIVVDE